MNCLEFRRLTLSEPGCTTEPYIVHSRGCPTCAAFLTAQTRIEQRLAEAVRVEQPSGLTSKILLRQAFSSAPPRQPWWRRPRAALAFASVVLVLMASLYGAKVFTASAGLDRTIVSLINEATFALAAKGPVDADQLASALEPVGIALDGDIGDVTFAGRCYVRDKLAGHIVLKGRSGPVTVLIIPNQRLLVRGHIESSHWSGVLVPAQDGAIAIVSAPGEPLAGIEERIVSAIRWPA